MDNLSGLRSIRSVGQRYRIDYQAQASAIVVLVMGMRKDGDKKDIYRILGKLFEE